MRFLTRSDELLDASFERSAIKMARVFYSSLVLYRPVLRGEVLSRLETKAPLMGGC